jgi:hypothetical protein
VLNSIRHNQVYEVQFLDLISSFTISNTAATPQLSQYIFLYIVMKVAHFYTQNRTGSCTFLH